MTYLAQCIRGVVLLSGVAFTIAVRASTLSDTAYFIFDGNPISVKYASGRLVRLPVQDADSVESLKKLEAVSALMSAPSLSALTDTTSPSTVKISPPQLPEYGVGMFEITTSSPQTQKSSKPMLIWSGRTPFREIELMSLDLGASEKQRLIEDSRQELSKKIDPFRKEATGRRMVIVGPVSIRSYGQTSGRSQLAFVDVTWRIKNLPKRLSENGIDSWTPYFRAEYVINLSSGRTLYRNITNVGRVEDRLMRLFKEPTGPLLMAVTIACTDGSEPFLLDLENETYSTGQKSDVKEVPHCFPAQ